MCKRNASFIYQDLLDLPGLPSACNNETMAIQLTVHQAWNPAMGYHSVQLPPQNFRDPAIPISKLGESGR